MSWLRVRTDRGNIVELKGFRMCAKHLSILRDLQTSAETVMLQCRMDGKDMLVCVHFLMLSDYDVRQLNPNATAKAS